MADALTEIVDEVGERNQADKMAKILADFDLQSLRKLERTRMMVRFGPALGLMGTLIPLSPALEGLANGDVKLLSDNLRVAFSVTVLGLLIGAIAFAVSLVRDRMYAQDLSDLEYVAATLTPGAAMSSRVRVRHRARASDRAGDPLDGLVNLFDLGIVLAVAFLLAALQSVNLTDLLTEENVTVLRTDAKGQTRHRQGGRPGQDRQAEQPDRHRHRHAARRGLPPVGRAPRLRQGQDAVVERLRANPAHVRARPACSFERTRSARGRDDRAFGDLPPQRKGGLPWRASDRQPPTFYGPTSPAWTAGAATATLPAADARRGRKRCAAPRA